jgi:hypothetical protein
MWFNRPVVQAIIIMSLVIPAGLASSKWPTNSAQRLDKLVETTVDGADTWRTVVTTG